MQFRDLQRQYERLKPQIDAAMQNVAAGAHYIMGPQVEELEQELAEWVGVRHCISCANGTDALTLALKAWGIGKGDAVFVPDFTFFSSAEVVPLEGATPVFYDVSRKTFNGCACELEKAIEETIKEGRLKPRAVVAVDLYGLPANFAKIKAVAEKYGLYILEDGAQGFGGSINGQRACSFGDIATTSFFPAKPLGCYGDGGAVFTDSDDWAALVKSYRIHGKGSNKYDNVRIGMNSRLDTLQAAILKIKFDAFKNLELDAVNEAADKYNSALKDTALTLPFIPEGFRSSWAQYTVQLPEPEKRDSLQAALKAKGIPSMVYYPTPMSRQSAFANAPVRECPNALSLCKSVLSLPMGPYISDNEIQSVCDALKSEL